MPLLHSAAEIRALHADWCAATATDPARGALAVLSDLLRRRGAQVTMADLRLAFGTGAEPWAMAEDRFADAAVLLFGAAPLRRAHAFGHLAGEGETLAVADLSGYLAHLGMANSEAIASELDRDGDGLVRLDDVEAALAHLDFEGTYRASHVRLRGAGAGSAPSAPLSAPREAAPQRQPQAPKAGGRMNAFAVTTHLHLQIGFFRLMQGAAYRSFRESYSAHSETHLRARDLPYTLPNFRRFATAAIRFYLALGVVEGAAASAEFDVLVHEVEAACDAVGARIAKWPHLHVTPQMAAAEQAVAAARNAERDHLRHLSDALEIVLVMRHHGLSPDAMGMDVLADHELKRLRLAELGNEHGHGGASGQGAGGPAKGDWLDSWTAVCMTDDGTRPDGAIMPVRFWYESFMPRLLRCASIRSDADLDALALETPEMLAEWHRGHVEVGTFDRYATDLRDGFATCPLWVQQALKQAWRLTEPYLGGLQKRREREEFGRESGALSQYVTFVDSWLGRSDIADAEMRISFPYFIGPAVWSFLHSAAEIVEGMDAPDRGQAIAAFKDFFRAFATMYPCPYCRYHFNRFVAVNKEVLSYPLEFLRLGAQGKTAGFDISLEERLATITADSPGSLRLFLWKLHNAVSSSIARTEEWYHRDENPLYTTRFWPSPEAELGRARALGQQTVPVDRLMAVVAITKPVAHLSGLRSALLAAMDRQDQAGIEACLRQADAEIARLDTAVAEAGMLQRSYVFDPAAEPAGVAFSLDEEAYARSGIFIER